MPLIYPPSSTSGVTAFRTANATAINASTTLVSDATLVLSLLAATSYEITGVLFYDCSTAADFKHRFTFSSSPTLCSIVATALQSGTTNATNTVTLGQRVADTSYTVGGAGVGTIVSLPFQGVVTTNLATTLTIQYAQGTSDATDLVVYAGSVLRARPLS